MTLEKDTIRKDRQGYIICRFDFLVITAFMIFGLVGCATLPAPELLDPQRAVIGISVKTRVPLLKFPDRPDMVYFIKGDEGEDLYTQGSESLIQSNNLEGGYVYLLNAEPGRYAAVACYLEKETEQGTYEYWTFFPEEMIKLTEVLVAPGTIAFMGEYVVDKSWGFKDLDNAQLQYFQLIAPHAMPALETYPQTEKSGEHTEVGFLTKVLEHIRASAWKMATHESYFKGSLHKNKCDKQAEIQFLTNALKHFEGADWINIIEKRIEDLKAEK
jgi:hypothetical protein